jgi:polar amino acid transport system permease protein
VDWRYVVTLFGNRDLWLATGTVVILSISTWGLGNVLGLLVALAKNTTIAPLRAAASIYVWFFRSLPLLVLLIFVYNLPQLAPQLSGVLSEPFWAGLVAMVVSETAYIAEIHRGGLLGVPQGQHEAGRALGIRYVGRLRLIVVPQALRIALPSLANEFITIVKLTSLVSVISLAEILLVGQRLYTRNFKVIDTLLAVAMYYVLIVSVFSLLIHFLERRLDVSLRKMPTPGPIDSKVVPLGRTEHALRRSIDETAEPILEIVEVTKSFGHRRVLDRVSLEVRRGEVVSIIGPSGSGKTTLIRTINALQKVDEGAILFDRKPWVEAKGGSYRLASHFNERVTAIGMVFQSFNLFPHLSVLDNVRLGPRYHHSGSRQSIEAAALAMLDKVGMLDHAHKFPFQLSGGQQQRVAIARALAMQPDIMLFDEPTSTLDPELVNEVLRVIEALANEGTTMVIVTHEMRFALSISDRVAFIDDGRIQTIATPAELLAAPAESRVASFLTQSRH